MYSYGLVVHSCREPRHGKDVVMQYLEADSESSAKKYCNSRKQYLHKSGYTDGESNIYMDSVSGQWMIEQEVSELYDDLAYPIVDLGNGSYQKVHTPSHIIVFVGGIPVRVDLWTVTRDGKRTLPQPTYDDLRDTFQWIFNALKSDSILQKRNSWFSTQVPWLTAADRDTWARA